MDLRALAKLVSLKAGDSADLDEVLRQYGISLDFGEKVELARMLAGDFSIVYDIVSDKFILIKARRAEQG
ncbi:hypothetical protein TUZN_0241 [Thermoproteus uzoniensis 768-20]|uniref:Uncharacterized protein n=1 Tax=Thermoproteus uzoniensis (strain 768-20) TaxID=999630 RepID=F2L1Z8_THEU7|nr:hypothetical protein [Thermoproteus uzoniensis]AEA11739.1 hypothetical protein TUZN_0241 [Thermoproteus uzoniensis 768-20]